MVLIVCIEDSNGLMFNNRRVSSDKVVTRDIVKLAGTQIITLSAYSAPLFKDFTDRVGIKEDIFDGTGSFCFAESGDFMSIMDSVEKLVVYKWNRRYPSDIKFPLDAFKTCMTLDSTEELGGYSHPSITREVYIR